MIDTKLHVSNAPSGEGECITHLSIEGCIEEISELIDSSIYLRLRENFRRSVANLFRQILEQHLEKAGEDPILFEQATERFYYLFFSNQLFKSASSAFKSGFLAAISCDSCHSLFRSPSFTFDPTRVKIGSW